MVNILAFPGKHTSSSHAHQDALGNDVALPVVTANMDGTLIVSRPTEHTRLSGDWSNQEVADLYRVEALLVQAGIRISTDRGVSDENDPWFVFCREDGEVFVHLARIDGQYLLDSPGLGGLLEGPDFPSLIDRFVSQVAARSEPKDNVVTFRPRMLHDQSVRLHPAVMLAALVWTLFLASDYIIGTAEAAENLAGDGGQIPDSVLHHGDHGTTATMAYTLSADLVSDHGGSHKAAATSPLQSVVGSDRQLAGAQEAARNLSQQDARGSTVTAFTNPVTTSQSVAASLAVIALGYGMYGPHPPTDAASVNAHLAALALETVTERPETDIVLAEADGSSIELQQVVKGEPSKPADATPVTVVYDAKIYAPLSTALTISSDAAGQSVSEDGTSSKFVAILLQEISTEDAGVVVAINTAQARSVAPAQETIAGSPAQETIAVASVTDAQNVLSLVSTHLGLISQYKIGETTVSATLDLASLDEVLVQLGEVASGPTLATYEAGAAPVPVPVLENTAGIGSSILGAKFARYDEHAKKFVHAFILDAGSIEMVQIKSELLLVDMTAIDEKTDYAVVRSWITDDGHVISTVGHYQAFVDFGLA